MKMMNSYKITYSLIAKSTGDILAENKECEISAKDVEGAFAAVIIKEQRRFSKEVMIVIHIVEENWHER